MTNVQELIDKLASAISFKFKEDGTSPNLTISKLRHGYYCSVVRYAKGTPAPKNKVVVCKFTGDTLESAVKGVVSEFLKVAKPEPDPVQELDSLSKSSK
jgi:hypothetical protein